MMLLIFVISLSSAWAFPVPKSRPFKNPELNPELFEGDMVGFNPKALQGAEIKSNRWPGGVIVYQIDDDLTAQEKAIFQAAVDGFAKKTCIKFKKRTCQKDYVSVQKLYGCFSYVGRNGGKQELSLDNGCWVTGIVQHEFMHALGFIHEHTRPDRDDYIAINYDNIPRAYWRQFDTYDVAEIDTAGTTYDYGSVMHYNAYAFAIDPTVITIDYPRNETIGQRVSISDTDAYEINVRYNCTAFL